MTSLNYLFYTRHQFATFASNVKAQANHIDKSQSPTNVQYNVNVIWLSLTDGFVYCYIRHNKSIITIKTNGTVQAMGSLKNITDERNNQSDLLRQD